MIGNDNLALISPYVGGRGCRSACGTVTYCYRRVMLRYLAIALAIAPCAAMSTPPPPPETVGSLFSFVGRPGLPIITCRLETLEEGSATVPPPPPGMPYPIDLRTRLPFGKPDYMRLPYYYGDHGWGHVVLQDVGPKTPPSLGTGDTDDGWEGYQFLGMHSADYPMAVIARVAATRVAEDAVQIWDVRSDAYAPSLSIPPSITFGVRCASLGTPPPPANMRHDLLWSKVSVWFEDHDFMKRIASLSACRLDDSNDVCDVTGFPRGRALIYDYPPAMSDTVPGTSEWIDFDVMADKMGPLRCAVKMRDSSAQDWSPAGAASRRKLYLKERKGACSPMAASAG